MVISASGKIKQGDVFFRYAVQEDFSEEVTLELQPSTHGISLVRSWGRSVWAEGTARAKVLGQAELSASGCRGAVLFLFSSSYPAPKLT